MNEGKLAEKRGRDEAQKLDGSNKRPRSAMKTKASEQEVITNFVLLLILMEKLDIKQSYKGLRQFLYDNTCAKDRYKSADTIRKFTGKGKLINEAVKLDLFKIKEFEFELDSQANKLPTEITALQFDYLNTPADFVENFFSKNKINKNKFPLIHFISRYVSNELKYNLDISLTKMIKSTNESKDIDFTLESWLDKQQKIVFNNNEEDIKINMAFLLFIMKEFDFHYKYFGLKSFIYFNTHVSRGDKPILREIFWKSYSDYFDTFVKYSRDDGFMLCIDQLDSATKQQVNSLSEELNRYPANKDEPKTYPLLSYVLSGIVNEKLKNKAWNALRQKEMCAQTEGNGDKRTHSLFFAANSQVKTTAIDNSVMQIVQNSN